MHRIFLLLLLFGIFSNSFSQQKITLNEFLNIAVNNSIHYKNARLDARIKQNEYLLSRTDYLPKISASLQFPNYSRAISPVIQPDGTEQFIERTNSNSTFSLSLTQKILLTGGTLNLSSYLNNYMSFNPEKESSFSSNWLLLNYSQPLNFFNAFKIEKEISNIEYNIDQLDNIKKVEKQNKETVKYFFYLIIRQRNYETSVNRLEEAEVVYKRAMNLFKTGKILESELIEAKIFLLESKQNVDASKKNYELQLKKVQSYLGMDEDFTLEEPFFKEFDPFKSYEIIKERLFKYSFNLDKELSLKIANNNLKGVKSRLLYSGTLNLSIGLNSTATKLNGLFKDPNEKEYAGIGISIPIVDWKAGKYRYQMALDYLETEKYYFDQKEIELEHKLLSDFNEIINLLSEIEILNEKIQLRELQIKILGNKLNEGKIDFTKYNDALTSKNISQTKLLTKTMDLWDIIFYYRDVALYDIYTNKPLI